MELVLFSLAVALLLRLLVHISDEGVGTAFKHIAFAFFYTFG